jgi:hypothetical protein
MAGLDPAIPLIEAQPCNIIGIAGSSPAMTTEAVGHQHRPPLSPPGAASPLASYATADCATEGPSPSSVVRRMSRTSLVSL